MRRLVISPLLAVIALAATAAGASAATTPVITSFSPAQVRVGQTLIINGKNFRKGITNNRVFFTRATDGKTVRARPSKASSSRRMEVVVPPAVAKFLDIKNGVAVGTRFQISVLSGAFSKKTPKSKSPIILPAAGPETPTGTPPVVVTPPPPADCDNDGTPDTTDTDDDNDGLSDDTEAAIHTDPCKPDTDGDGVPDAYEYYSAIDLNGGPGVSYAGKRPYPNPLDASDANNDFDGDGMTQKEEFAASAKFGTANSQPLTYSDGNQQSVAGAGVGAMDLDNNGRITDDEKDADGDGLPNWVELAKGEKAPPSNGQATCAFTTTTGNATWAATDKFTDCGAGARPNGNTFAPIARLSFEEFATDYLDPDTDGDGINDGADDQDHDGLNNTEEIVAGSDGLFTGPQEPCDPNPQAPVCQRHS